MNFEGIYPPVITPYNEDFSIDFAGFERMLEHLIASGVHGIIVGGTTGEVYAQSKEERMELMRIAGETVSKRVPLLMGVGAIRTEDCIEYGAAARSSGADGILLSAPYYAVPTPTELAHHVLAVDRAVGLPIMLYNFPGRTGTTMGREFFDAVADSPNIAAVKDSTGDINQLHMLALDYAHIALMCGMDDQALEFFAWGARGWVCAGGNCLPDEHIALYRAVVLQNDIVKGRRIMSAMMPFLHILEQGGKLIQFVKHGCAMQGLPAGTVRKPLEPLTAAESKELKTVLDEVKRSMAQVMDAPSAGEALSINR